MDKVLLLYSGGLDTSVMVKWIQKEMKKEVVTLTLNIGNSNLEEIKEKAISLGVSDAIVMDVKNEFADNYIKKEIFADGMYEGYPLSTAIARPLMAEKAVYYAREYGCNTIAHGSTGKGNDQVRFEVTVKAIDENINVIAPVRDWNMNRPDEISYAKKNGIKIPKDGKYSVDENIWGRSAEGSTIENISNPLEDDVYEWVSPLEETGNGETVDLEFVNGIPHAINGNEFSLEEIVEKMNIIAGRNGIGLINHMEDRVTGIKSHEVYEVPGAMAILHAHKMIESLTLNKYEIDLKEYMDSQWSNFTYNGLWHDPVMEHINDFECSVNKYVNGKIKLKLYKGNMIMKSIESDNSIYNYEKISYDNSNFNQDSARGFIDIYKNNTVYTNNARKQKISVMQ
ncbi:MAG: argininosuccinate synthase [Ferroplasma sp.]|uniref:argininosuccinate synthase n=1 Tax=Ferroplasma sp. TaxID=2591003 RepID=UPI00281640B4|nr:argininosuccinate synthase [Ferroplasma sp.]WMT51578.1 MAG: argininosuccinate synthase [Ferroplasma sp.]